MASIFYPLIKDKLRWTLEQAISFFWRKGKGQIVILVMKKLKKSYSFRKLGETEANINLIVLESEEVSLLVR